MAPKRRDTTQQPYAVAKPVALAECRAASVIIRRLWH